MASKKKRTSGAITRKDNDKKQDVNDNVDLPTEITEALEDLPEPQRKKIINAIVGVSYRQLSL